MKIWEAKEEKWARRSLPDSIHLAASSLVLLGEFFYFSDEGYPCMSHSLKLKVHWFQVFTAWFTWNFLSGSPAMNASYNEDAVSCSCSLEATHSFSLNWLSLSLALCNQPSIDFNWSHHCHCIPCFIFVPIWDQNNVLSVTSHLYKKITNSSFQDGSDTVLNWGYQYA